MKGSNIFIFIAIYLEKKLEKVSTLNGLLTNFKEIINNT